MLLRFEATNHRSISSPVELSLVAVDADRPAARPFDLLDDPVLTVAGIYGANASGKSNVLDALAWLSAAVRRSLRVWDEGIPRDPFGFGDGPSAPSTYELDLMVEDVRHTYALAVDDTEVQFEGLYSYPLRKRRTLFEREGSKLEFRRGLSGAGGTRELVTPTSLALSAAMRLGEPELEPIGRSIARIQALGVPHRLQGRRYGPPAGVADDTQRLFDEESIQRSPVDPDDTTPAGPRASALALLQIADLGIDDVRMIEQPDDIPGRGEIRLRRIVHLVHNVAGEELSLDLGQESAGTRTWFRLIGPVLAALRRGQVLLFDEIDASLHPRLSARLVELFQDPETNPQGAQLIFTSHDTSLLNHLNRDEVWLTEKGEDGATTLTAVAEYGGEKVRRSHNLERAYLQGRFGAVPDLDQHVVRQALGIAGDR